MNEAYKQELEQRKVAALENQAASLRSIAMSLAAFHDKLKEEEAKKKSKYRP